MMTIREYFATIEDLETRWDAEDALVESIESDEDFDFEAWAEARGIDLDAVDARTGLRVLDLWSWDMWDD